MRRCCLLLILLAGVVTKVPLGATPVYYPVEIPLEDKEKWEFLRGPSGHLETGKAIFKRQVDAKGLKWITFRFTRKETNKGVGCTVFLNYKDEKNFTYCRLSFSKDGHYDVWFGQKLDGKLQGLLYHQGTNPKTDIANFELKYAMSDGKAHIYWTLGRNCNIYHEDIVPTGGNRVGYRISNKRLVVQKIALAYDKPQK